MIRTTAMVDGMQCGMCETHINETVRKTFPVKKVTSSHKKGCTEIISEEPVQEELLRRAIAEAGYTVGKVTSETYEKHGFWGRRAK